MFGQPIVHGLHLLLWSLEEWVKATGGSNIAALDVRLLKPAFLGESIELEHKAISADTHLLTCRSGQAQLCTTKITLGAGSDRTPWEPASASRADAPDDFAFAELSERNGETLLDATEKDLLAAFPLTTKLLGAERVAGLIGLTRLVGMECPGLNSIFSSIAVRLDGPSGNRLLWRVVKANPRLSLLNIAVSGGGLDGVLVAFYRPTPQAPLFAQEVATTFPPDSTTGRRALIVGGSRGLGRIAAIMLAAAGAEVAVTYRSGREEAEGVGADIAGLGAKAHVVSLDVAAPDEVIAALATDGFVPDELYYFATPHIFVRKKALFEEDLFASFADSYVSGMMRIVQSIRAHSDGPLRIFLPSSEALDTPLVELFEYTVAKAAAESLATLLPLFDKKISVVVRRLPRLPTDQTRTLMEMTSADPIATLKEVCAAMAPAGGAAIMEPA